MQTLLNRFPAFAPAVESLGTLLIINPFFLEFPGEMRQNFLVTKGRIEAKVNNQAHQFPIKVVIPQGFPFKPPKVFLDMSITMHMLQSKTYLAP